MTELIVAQGTLWLLLVTVAMTMLLLLWRIREFYRHVAPLGALTPAQPSVSHLERHTFIASDGSCCTIGGIRPDGQRQLLLFISGTCPVSKKMIPVTRSFCDRENISLIFVTDDTAEGEQKLVRTLDIDSGHLINNTETGRMLAVDRVPFAVLLKQSGDVEARGLVNNREHLESLLTVTETGYESIQSFLAAHPHALAS
ncbi:thioredoxin domain-containing protein [Acetobacter fallax]|uniref:Methylamine dehydrogenase n=1 Tax=Acetobacter fallax TaxID=1737473 RepID=A0ABX0K9V5_9PROT|nr:methylamine dehydrogenase [Acetobacter fallax]NHO32588.1 methylamine dehydrogenase [Acetobacter fallax]NHO36214.1 methylamine dehydrogenase [Acetobacter fallax]